MGSILSSLKYWSCWEEYQVRKRERGGNFGEENKGLTKLGVGKNIKLKELYTLLTYLITDSDMKLFQQKLFLLSEMVYSVITFASIRWSDLVFPAENIVGCQYPTGYPVIRPAGYPANKTGYLAEYRIPKKAGYPVQPQCQVKHLKIKL